MLEGEVPVTAAMREALSEQELRDGWRLACCASAAGRVVVEVEQWSLPVLTDEARVPIEPRAGRGAVIDLGTTTLVVQVVDLDQRRSAARGDRAQPAGALRRRRDEPPAIRPGPAGRTGPPDPRDARPDAGRRAAARGAGGGQHGHAPSLLRPGCGAADARAVRLAHAGRLPLRRGGTGMAGAGRVPALPGRIRRQRPALRHRGHAPGPAGAAARALRHRHQRRGGGGVGAGDCVRVDGGRPGVRRRAHWRGDACRARAPSTACTCATAGSTATSSAAARRAASAAAAWWTRRRAASNWA